MIIRMTVQDNDYWSELKDFAGRLSPTRLRENGDDTETYAKIVTLFRSKETEEHTVTDRFFILKRINHAWIEYVNSLWDDEDDAKTKHYLISNFSVEIVDSFKEKQENNEYVYYFSNSGAVIAQ